MRKEKRIKKNKEFQQVFQHGKSMANRQFVLYVLEKKDQAEFKIGLSVSKKIGNAVTRNRIKRYIRQVFTELEADIVTTGDIVIIARKPTAEMSYEEVKSSLIHIFKKISLLRKTVPSRKD
ncbi:ribonuclease P protein component [Sutcliffiella cohnii]|uniref:Ribonuclease P protein component n=1 Tax=Sutcliffiella cohnii TaxID=33932 RepID=A0A223KWV5_9BACI|nr:MULTISPECIES: ribonuclease P protein component [Sutcliffiella]AST93932.1 ribonuclease P protein component [Sutcliffiella cohnii]MED4015723.1 ribonuclease P protein component [Sutcliffiella cohnii]WBL15137.1 ribonuclease P protein component [Sutcliffiella sp. NC1]